MTFLVRGTSFTTGFNNSNESMEKQFMHLNLIILSFKYFELNKEGYFQSLGHIPLTHCIKLELKIH